jgi:D-erythronate 2-dehydrogenase
MLEAARRTQDFPKFVFASAGATMGSGAPTDYIQKEDTIADSTCATPHTTYGMTKACCELLLSDFGRRGFVNARALRLPTIAVRAGAPNASTAGCYSGVIREPLAGINVTLPIARTVPHAVTGKQAAIHAMVLLHNAKLEESSVLGYDRTVFLPAIALSLGDLQEALVKVVTPISQAKLGTITYQVDETLSVVVGFPTKVDAS